MSEMPKLQQIELPNTLGVLGDSVLQNNAMLAQTLKRTIKKYYSSTIINAKKQDLPQALLGWGNKTSFQQAKSYANELNLTVFSVDDGFLRSINTDTNNRHSLSLVVDDLGIYYDLTQASRLEKMILARLTSKNWSQQHYHYAQQIIQTIYEHNLSKYNTSLACPNLDKLTFSPKHVLVIDQVVGDSSIIGAGLDNDTAQKQFTDMLINACKNHPKANIWIKTHPAGKGYLTELNLAKTINFSTNNIYILDNEVNPIALLKQVQHVYTVSSHLGFEALMLSTVAEKKTVHCYGVNWYSAWGLTDDSGILSGGERLRQLYQQVKDRRFQKSIDLDKKELLAPPLRKRALYPTKSKDRMNAIKENDSSITKGKVWEGIKVHVEQLFFSAYLDYSHYVDLITKTSSNIDNTMNWLITNRHWHNQLKGKLTLYELNNTQLPTVRDFVDFADTKIFVKPQLSWKNCLHPNHFFVKLSNPLLVSGLENYHKLTAHKKTDKVYCMEDGFIRTNGLEKPATHPLSLVLDQQGIYYKATDPSDLEILLKNCPKLTQVEEDRVHALQQRLLSQRITQYPLADEEKSDQLNKLDYVASKKILIVGQTKEHLSVQYCGSTIQSNAELINQVKQDNPYAYLIYKPHPDIEAGLQVDTVDKQTLSQVDMVALDTSMPDCLQAIDEVHTISSFAGFEGLLYNKKVVCYGLPFYAGWGLTVDKNKEIAPISNYLIRRQREQALTLEQLIYCTLIKYPLYHLPNGYGLAQVEQVIDYLNPPEPQKDK